MVLLQAEISMQTFLKVFIVHGILMGTFIFFALMVLKRDRKWPNISISCFYLFFAIGFIINWIYVLLSYGDNSPIVTALYYTTMFFLILATFFVTVFVINLLTSEELFSKKKQLLLIIIVSLIIIGMVLIPGGLTIGPSTNWNPVYSLPYYLYVFAVFTGISVVPQLVGFFKVYKSLHEDNIKTRWRFLMLGIILLYIFCYGTILYHYLDIQIIRTIWSFISLGLAIASAILIYYGIIKL